eukprot:10894923-Alexandrium_andersonii.AAC.1
MPKGSKASSSKVTVAPFAVWCSRDCEMRVPPVCDILASVGPGGRRRATDGLGDIALAMLFHAAAPWAVAT